MLFILIVLLWIKTNFENAASNSINVKLNIIMYRKHEMRSQA